MDTTSAVGLIVALALFITGIGLREIVENCRLRFLLRELRNAVEEQVEFPDERMPTYGPMQKANAFLGDRHVWQE